MMNVDPVAPPPPLGGALPLDVGVGVVVVVVVVVVAVVVVVVVVVVLLNSVSASQLPVNGSLRKSWGNLENRCQVCR